MENTKLRKIVSGQGKSIKDLEITYSTLVGIHVKKSNEGEEYYPDIFIILADKIIPENQGVKGVRLEFCPSSDVAERYVLETRTEIMQVLPIQKPTIGKTAPRWKLFDPKENIFRISGAYLGFREIAGSFENVRKEFKPYQELFNSYSISWNKKGVFGNTSGLELRFEFESEK